MNRNTKLQIVIHVIVVVMILFAAALPLISVTIAGGIANANGCLLDEAGVHPCVVNGQDVGETLYSMGVSGWFLLVTIPLGLAVVVLYVIIVGAFYTVRYVRRPRAEIDPRDDLLV